MTNSNRGRTYRLRDIFLRIEVANRHLYIVYWLSTHSGGTPSNILSTWSIHHWVGYNSVAVTRGLSSFV